jgi:hypothetical protein
MTELKFESSMPNQEYEAWYYLQQAMYIGFHSSCTIKRLMGRLSGRSRAGRRTKWTSHLWRIFRMTMIMSFPDLAVASTVT